MERHRVALALFAAAAVCFALVLASVIGSDFAVNEPAWLAAGFLASALGLVVERIR